MLSYSLNTIFAFSSLVLLTFSHPTLFFKITKRSKFNYSHKKRKDFDWINFSLQNWHDQSNIFWPKHSKVSKIFALMGSFLSKVYTVWTKSAEEFSFITLKSDAKFGWELTCRFKTDMTNLTSFDPSTQ